MKRFYNSSIAGGEIVIAASAFLGDYLAQSYGVSQDRLRVIHRGVAVEKFHPNAVSPERLIRVAQQMRVPEGAAVIMCPARLTRIKGHMFLLDAIEKLGRKDVFCLFLGSDIGSEGYRAELEKYIALKGLEAQTRIVTDCNDMPAAYMMATAVVVPSLVPEGFGRVAVEAQAMGRPVIATDHGGARETVIPGETGWLVPPKDTAALAAALAEALDLDAQDRALLATRAMSHVAKNFTNAKMCKETLDAYAEVMEMAHKTRQKEAG
jgi:glycosyltransferase involved in cell wall biosynthesis